jgi:ABC-type cobalamin/Fe3+-siderophores transport system ATPase subunit
VLKVRNLNCGYKDKVILKDVSFTAGSGDIVCILGPNGSGKSTLIKTIVGLIDPYEGEILIKDEKIKDWSWNRRGKTISYIPQTFSSMFQYKAIDIVLMGRTAYLGLGSPPSEEDEKIAEEAMKMLKILHLRDKIYSQLSGGERQLVKIAQALAQQSKIIIMDEPTNNLDFGNQLVMLNHIKQCANLGITIIMATHFPEQALLYGSKVLLVKDKSVVEIDNPNENLKEKDLRNLYDVKIKIVELELEDTTMKVCLPLL